MPKEMAAANKGYTPGGSLRINELSYFYRAFDAERSNSAWYSARGIASPVIVNSPKLNKGYGAGGREGQPGATQKEKEWKEQ